MKVLLIEDDQQAATAIIAALAREEIIVAHVPDGAAGLSHAQTEDFDVLVVDRMLPKLDGLSLVKTLRDQQYQTPILFVSALAQIDDRVAGLEAGADDYLSKPFAMRELIARLHVLVRRKAPITQSLQIADLSVDLLSREVHRQGEMIDVQGREYDLLVFLLQHAGTIVTRQMLLKEIWQLDFDPQTNVIDVHISRLRGKIDKGFSPALLHTIRGQGYVMREAAHD